MFKKVIRFLSSLRFTIVLICMLGCIFAAGLWVPQKKLLQVIYLEWKHNSPILVKVLDTLGLTYIYTCPLTITLWVFFFINLGLVIWQRIPVIKSRITLSEKKIVDPETAAGYLYKKSFPLPANMDGETVLGLIRQRGYTLLGGSTGFYGVKNRLSPIAFLLFHVSFFLILLGGLVTMYTKFYGYVDLAQGENFKGEINRYNKSPRVKVPVIGSPPNVDFTVQSIVPHVVKNTPTGITIKLLDGRGQLHEMGINTPYKTENSSFVFDQLGVAPLVVLKDPAGKEVDGAYSKLDVLLGREDRFKMGGFEFVANFLPDFVMLKGEPRTLTQEFNNPTFNLVVKRDGRKIAEGNVGKNGHMDFGGYRLEIQDMLFWVRFQVVKQSGLAILYLGFAIATIGVMWRLLWYRREMVGAVRNENGTPCLVVAARSEYYKSLAEDEFTKLFHGVLGIPMPEND